MRNVYIVLLFPIMLLSLIGCGGDSDTPPDVTDINVSINSKRFDKDLYNIDTNNFAAELQQLEKKYPDFLPFYLDQLMGFGVRGNYSDTAMAIKEGIRAFMTHKDYRGVFDTVLAKYPETKDIEEQLTQGFKYTKYYLKDYQVPEVIYMVTGLQNHAAITIGSDQLAIGLDMFLGSDYPFYKSVGLADYATIKFNKENIPVAAFRTIYRLHQPFDAQGKVLLDMMINSGKEMYFVSKVLPFVDEHIRLGYTKEQLEWCEQNEAMVYDFFIRQELLYENNLQKVIRYVMEGPNSTGMPPESPGNIGAWLGLQMVKAYMKKHPEMTLEELMKEQKDPQIFLQESKYKPK